MMKINLNRTPWKNLFSLPKPFAAKLSRQFFFIILSIIIVSFSIIYLFSVPLIQKNIFDIERNSSRLVLNNVFELASRMYSNVEDYKSQALKAHQKQLQVAVSLSASHIRAKFRDAKLAGVPLAQAKKKILLDIKELTYGNNDYIWIANYQGVLISHPDARFHEKTTNPALDEKGQPIVASIVKRVLKEGEGFYQYKWNRLEETEPLDKVSYVKHFPKWGFVIGSGVYLDDLEKEIKTRKDAALSDLREALKEIKVAKTGYLYIFDSNKKMLIHPNKNIDGTVFKTLKNPLTQQSIADELIKAADTGKELKYLWDKPTEPGNYRYEKFSLVRYLPGFDWYICSSVYLEELRSSSTTLTNRLITLAALTTIAAIFFSYFFVTRITRPLEQLSNAAHQVQKGDLSAKSGITGNDEVGILAVSFDGMVERLKTNIETLDLEVKQRTEELLKANAQAQRMSAVGQLAGGLAHDFNNLLSIILGNLLLARSRYKETKGLEHFLTPAVRASRRGADITHRLLAFSCRQPLHPIAVDVEPLMTETTKLLKGSLPSRIALTYQSESSPLTVHVDPSHLESALVNLGFNARDAISTTGILTFKTCLVRVGEEQTAGYDEPVPKGQYLNISVTDSGSGFSQEALDKAFEPFYTTKTGNNSGLGLSMVYGFVKQSEGYLSITSEVNKGSCVKLLLPLWLTPTPLVSKASYLPPQIDAYSNTLFLLVEDNDDVRKVIREQLILLGINVIEATNATEAEQLINSIDTLDGMISDYMLNDHLNGQQLAELLYKKSPRSIILIISGYAYEPKKSREKTVTFPLLRKPFDQEALSHALWAAIQTIKKEQADNADQ